MTDDALERLIVSGAGTRVAGKNYLLLLSMLDSMSCGWFELLFSPVIWQAKR
jgi:hypothetical protein